MKSGLNVDNIIAPYNGFFKKFFLKRCCLRIRKCKVKNFCSSFQVTMCFWQVLKAVPLRYCAYSRRVILCHAVNSGNQIYFKPVFFCQPFQQCVLSAAGASAIFKNRKNIIFIFISAISQAFYIQAGVCKRADALCQESPGNIAIVLNIAVRQRHNYSLWLICLTILSFQSLKSPAIICFLASRTSHI